MRHLTTLLTMAITFTGLAQQMPYNPDANGDDFVGVDDVLGVLGVYDTALMQPDLQCDYEGTDLEQWVGDLFNPTIHLDSIYVEYLLMDSVQTFLPGCPDPVIVETVLERSYVIKDNIGYQNDSDYDRWYRSSYYLNFLRVFVVRFNSNGTYQLRLEDYEVEELTSFSNTASWNPIVVSIPFPEAWALGADGIEVDWHPNSWVANCDHFRVIPFWSEAE